MTLLHAGYHHAVVREWQKKFQFGKVNLMFPLFIVEGDAEAYQPIEAMPEQYRLGVDRLVEHLTPLVGAGLRSVLLFGVIMEQNSALKDSIGSRADQENGVVRQAIKILRTAFPSLCIACDVCLCPYTDHGHCGVLYKDGTIDNEASCKRLAQVALSYALAGADIVAPSDMMDGRIGIIKQALIDADIVHRVALMSYSAKFASAFYGPFRDAAKSAPLSGDRKCYQLPPGARGLARRAVQRDIQQGADIVMVKPGYPYLDIVQDCSSNVAPDHPIAVYQVSGEYSMLYHAAITHKVVDLQQGVIESVEAYARAGASLVITYWTPQLLKWLQH